MTKKQKNLGILFDHGMITSQQCNMAIKKASRILRARREVSKENKKALISSDRA